MKPTFAALAVAGFAAAQNLNGVPECVGTCIAAALNKVCTDKAQLAACACKPDIMSSVTKTIFECATNKGCDSAELIKAKSISDEQCKAFASGSATVSSAAVNSTVTTGTGGVPTHSSNQTNQTATATSGATGTTKTPTSQRGSATSTGTGTVPTTTGAAAAGPVVGALAAVLAAALAL